MYGSEWNERTVNYRSGMHGLLSEQSNRETASRFVQP